MKLRKNTPAENKYIDMLIKDSFFTDPIPYLTGFNNADLAEGSVTLTYKF